MDKPTTPGESNSSKSPWSEEPASEQSAGATGIFAAVKPPQPGPGQVAGSPAGPGSHWYRAPETVKPQPEPPAKTLVEPLVHGVVFGGGAADSSLDTLERIRIAAADRESHAEKAPGPGFGPKSTSAQPGSPDAGQGSGGFTQLLRTLGSEPSPAASAAKVAPPPAEPRPASDSGFTSLLQRLGTPSAQQPLPSAPPLGRPILEELPKAPASSESSGFTELLRAEPSGSFHSGGAQTQSFAPGGGPVSPVSARPNPVPESAPEGFTQLFASLGAEGASPSPPAHADRAPMDSPAGSPGSFTRMFAHEQQTAGPRRPFAEQGPPANLEFGPAPRPTPASRDPFSPSALPESQPPQSHPEISGAGITRLIRMLDEPAAQRADVAPVTPPSASEPGVWTRTFASLASPGDAPAAKPSQWPPAQPAPPAAPLPREPGFPGSSNQPAGNAAGPAFGTQGPSEFTRILDASRMRELGLRGGTHVGAETPRQELAPQQATAPSQAPMLGYPLPAAPPPPAMPGLGAMPQPRIYTPPRAPADPASYAPHAGAAPAAGGGFPPPGMYAPAAPPMPAKPQLPPVKPPESGMGKLQQYVPLLLVMIIVLLVALLVTMVFLIKH